jgi:poly(A) polymerase
VQELFQHTIPVGVKFGVVIVVQAGIPFEVATLRTDAGSDDGRHPSHIVFTDARHDAMRRDFTINGLFYDPLTGQISDYVSGIDDINNRVIRAIGDPTRRFQEDYLRLLRAVRFAARFDFSIDPATWESVRAHAGLITQISPERVFAELDRMLRQGHADRAVTLLSGAGLLKHVLPEVADCMGVEQPPEFHPEGDVFSHVVKALSLMKPDPSQTLAWSVLLHDIGKKATMRVAERIRFNNHDNVGAAMAAVILRRLRAPTAIVESVEYCIGNHMNFMNVMVMRLSTLKKLLSRPTIHDEIELHRVDCLASHGNIDNCTFVEDHLRAFAIERIRPEPLVGGKDLIALGLKPGPLFGEILQEVYDLQLDEKIRSRDEAMAIVREKWAGMKDPCPLSGNQLY